MFEKITQNYMAKLQNEKLFQIADSIVSNFIKKFYPDFKYEEFLKYYDSYMERTLQVFIELLQKIREQTELPAQDIFDKAHNKVLPFLEKLDIKEYEDFIKQYPELMQETIQVFINLLNIVKGKK